MRPNRSEAEERVPGQPWPDIRGIGNWLRHQYERFELPVLWKTVRDDLPPLKIAVLRALAPHPANPNAPTTKYVRKFLAPRRRLHVYNRRIPSGHCQIRYHRFPYE